MKKFHKGLVVFLVTLFLFQSNSLLLFADPTPLSSSSPDQNAPDEPQNTEIQEEAKEPISSTPTTPANNTLNVFNVRTPKVQQNSASVIFRGDPNNTSRFFVDYKKCDNGICDTSWINYESQPATLYGQYYAELKNLVSGNTYVFRIRTENWRGVATAETNANGKLFTFKTLWAKGENLNSESESISDAPEITFVNLFAAEVTFTTVSAAFEVDDVTKLRTDLSYEVDFRKKGISVWEVRTGIPRIVALSYFIEILNLSPGTEYEFRIRVVNADKLTVKTSDIFEGKTKSFGFNNVYHAEITATSLTAIFEVDAEAREKNLNYTAEHRQKGDVLWTESESEIQTIALTYHLTIKFLKPETDYEVRIKAKDSNGVLIGTSEPFTAKTNPDFSSTPSNNAEPTPEPSQPINIQAPIPTDPLESIVPEEPINTLIPEVTTPTPEITEDSKPEEVSDSTESTDQTVEEVSETSEEPAAEENTALKMGAPEFIGIPQIAKKHNGSVVISFQTTEEANGLVQYGPNKKYEYSSEATSGVIHHYITISSNEKTKLVAGENYYYRITIIDNDGWENTYEGTFTAPKPRRSWFSLFQRNN